ARRARAPVGVGGLVVQLAGRGSPPGGAAPPRPAGGRGPRGAGGGGARRAPPPPPLDERFLTVALERRNFRLQPHDVRMPAREAAPFEDLEVTLQRFDPLVGRGGHGRSGARRPRFERGARAVGDALPSFHALSLP